MEIFEHINRIIATYLFLSWRKIRKNKGSSTIPVHQCCHISSCLQEMLFIIKKLFSAAMNQHEILICKQLLYMRKIEPKQSIMQYVDAYRNKVPGKVKFSTTDWPI